MLGALIVGLLDAYGRWLLPDFSYFVLFGPMAHFCCSGRPGIFGRAHEDAGQSRLHRHRVLALAAALAAPLAAGPFWITLLTQILIFGLLALAVDLLLGHAGLFSVCHASFFAVAAYTVAILQVRYGADHCRGPSGNPGRHTACVISRRCRANAWRLFHPDHIAMGYIIWGVALSLGLVHGRRQRRHQCAASAASASLSLDDMTATTISCWLSLSCARLAYRILVRSPFGLTLRGIKISESGMTSLGFRRRPSSVCGIRALRRFGQPRRRSLRLLQPLHQSGGGVVPDLGRGSSDGDRRRDRHDPGALPRCRHHPGAAQLGERLLRLHTAIMGAVFIVTVLWAPHGIMGLVARLAPSNVGAIMSGAAIRVDQLVKAFGGLRAVNGASLIVRCGERRVSDRAQRRRKDDAVSLYHRHIARDDRRVLCSDAMSRESTRPDERRSAWAARFRYRMSLPICLLRKISTLAMLGKTSRKWITYRSVVCLSGTSGAGRLKALNWWDWQTGPASRENALLR